MKYLHFVIFFIFIYVLVSCKNKQDALSHMTVFRYNEASGITSLDPAFAKDQANIWACNQLFNGLVQINDQLEITPCIAKYWEISRNGTIFTFYLRDDVYFHDNKAFKDEKGRRVVAKDFVYSFNRILDDKNPTYGSWVFNKVARVDGQYMFQAINDTCFRITLSEAFPPFLSLLSMQYCVVIPNEAISLYGKDFRRNPVGTGPFMYKMWKEGVKLVLVKNPQYFEFEGKSRLPYIDAIAISFIIDKQSAFLEFVKGKLDFMSGIDPAYKDEVLTRHGKLNPKYKNQFSLISQPYLNTEYLAFLVDTSLPAGVSSPVQQLKIRKAINYGFDRGKMIRYLRNNIGTPGYYGIVPPGMVSFDTYQLKGYDYNPEKARQLLAEAGFPNGYGLPEIMLSTTSEYVDLCKYIMAQLAELGIRIRIEVNPAATLKELKAQAKLPFFRASWIADYPDAENYLSLFYSKNFCPAGPNYTHYSNPEFDRLYSLAQQETIDKLRFTYYWQMDQMIMNDAPVVILYYDQVLRFVQNNISDIGLNAMNLLSLKKVKKSL